MPTCCHRIWVAGWTRIGVGSGLLLDPQGAGRYAVGDAMGGEGQQAVATHRGVGAEPLGIDAERLGDVDGTAPSRRRFHTVVEAAEKASSAGSEAPMSEPACSLSPSTWCRTMRPRPGGSPGRENSAGWSSATVQADQPLSSW